MLNIALVCKYVAHMGRWPSGFSKINLRITWYTRVYVYNPFKPSLQPLTRDVCQTLCSNPPRATYWQKYMVDWIKSRWPEMWLISLFTLHVCDVMWWHALLLCKRYHALWPEIPTEVIYWSWSKSLSSKGV